MVGQSVGSPFLTAILPIRLPLTYSFKIFFLRQMAIFIWRNLVAVAPHLGQAGKMGRDDQEMQGGGPNTA